MRTIRLVLVDDHHIVRAGLRALLHTFPDVEVVADTGESRKVLELIGAYRPDIVLMDIAMPALNGLELTVRITKAFHKVRVIVLSMHANPEYVVGSLRVGASGYVLKGADPTVLAAAIKTVADGKIYLCELLKKSLVLDQRQVRDVVSVFERLTPRQREILQLIGEGHSTKEIASVLKISHKTVETHRAQVMQRLQIDSIAGLVRYALHIGLTA